MKKILIIIFILVIFRAGMVYSAVSHDHDHDHKETGHSHTEDSSEDHAEDHLGFSMEIPQKTQELIGLKTEKIASSSVGEKIFIVGRIVQDVEHTVEVLAPEKGILKECTVSLGSMITQGEAICFMENSDSKVTEIKATANGTIMAQFINTGESIDTVSPIFMVADLSKLLANFDIYEKDIDKVKNAQRVLLYATAYPDKVFEGKIIFVSPRVEEASFTVKVRVEVNNPDLLLKPGMFLRGAILVDDKKAHLIVPSDSVQNIDGMNVVFIQDDKESFTPTKVIMKLASHKQAFIEGDIKEGDRVVSEGAFMLKSKVLEDEIAGGCSH
jgi:cobalt-zinc-cadmium efflux system membrane fusion protein